MIRHMDSFEAISNRQGRQAVTAVAEPFQTGKEDKPSRPSQRWTHNPETRKPEAFSSATDWRREAERQELEMQEFQRPESKTCSTEQTGVFQSRQGRRAVALAFQDCHATLIKQA